VQKHTEDQTTPIIYSFPGIHERPWNITIVSPNPAQNEQTLIYRGLGLLTFKATIVDKGAFKLRV